MTDDLWTEYLSTRDQATRNQLLLRYHSLVRYVAARVAATLPGTVDREDLVSYGLFGLVDAIEKFEPDRGVRFESYAVTRIRGAILDELRAMDWAPRSVRSRARWLARTAEELSQRLQRDPSPQELAEALGWAIADVHAVRAQAADGYLAALGNDAELEDGAGLRLERTPEDVTTEDPVLTTEVDLTRQLVAQAMAGLPDRERVVVTLYYRHGLTLAEAGTVLGVTESRVCQVYTSAMLGVREFLAAGR